MIICYSNIQSAGQGIHYQLDHISSQILESNAITIALIKPSQKSETDVAIADVVYYFDKMLRVVKGGFFQS